MSDDRMMEIDRVLVHITSYETRNMLSPPILASYEDMHTEIPCGVLLGS